MSLIKDCIKSLASRDDIHSLKFLLIEQKNLIITMKEKLEGIVTLNKVSVKVLEDRVGKLEEEVCFLHNQDQLKERKIDDQEQYSRRQCLRMKGF